MTDDSSDSETNRFDYYLDNDGFLSELIDIGNYGIDRTLADNFVSEEENAQLIISCRTKWRNYFSSCVTHYSDTRFTSNITNLALIKLHQILDSVHKEEINFVIAAPITAPLVSALFNPENHELYDIFNEHRLPVLLDTTAPTHAILELSFSYVGTLLDSLQLAIGLSGRTEVLQALTVQLNNLKAASETYWPWNYGSQSQLHAILNAIIALKHPRVRTEEVPAAINLGQNGNSVNQSRMYRSNPAELDSDRMIHQERRVLTNSTLSKEIIITQLKDANSALYKSLNQRSLFSFSAETAALRAVKAAIAAEENPQSRTTYTYDNTSCSLNLTSISCW